MQRSYDQKIIISPKVVTKMLNTLKGNEGSCKANFTRYRCANRGSRMQVFPSFRGENAFIVA